MNEHLDIFNVPIKINSTVLASLPQGLEFCKVIKFNKSSVTVTQLKFKNGKRYTMKPHHIVTLREDDMLYISLKGITRVEE